MGTQKIDQINPRVSVVIPTRNRPKLVLRALQSVLAQTLRDIEVIVVVDGPDEITSRALNEIVDSRLRVEVLPTHLGFSIIRNAGVSVARGDWVAFLDDDDEWLPDKLHLQLSTAKHSRFSKPIIACRVVARSEYGERVLPLRFPAENEPLSEYLLCQNSLLPGEGLVIPSAILASKELLLQIPYNRNVGLYDGTDWVLRASMLEGVGIEFPMQIDPLVIWHVEEDRIRMSRSARWHESLTWAQSNRYLFTSRSYAALMLTWVSALAARRYDWKAFMALMLEAYHYGKPSAIDLILHFAIWFVPIRVRRWVNLLFGRPNHMRPLKPNGVNQ